MQEGMAAALGLFGCGLAFAAVAVACGTPPSPRLKPRVYVELDDVAIPFASGMAWPAPTLFVDPGGVIWLRYERAREGRVVVAQVHSMGPDGLVRAPCVEAMPPLRGQQGLDYIRLEWASGATGCVTQLVLLSEERGALVLGVEVSAEPGGKLEVGQRARPVREGDQDELVVTRAGETRTLHLGRGGGEALVVLPAGDYECRVGARSTGDAVLLDVDDRGGEAVVSWLVVRPGYVRLEHLRASDSSCMIAHIYAAGRRGS